TGLDELADIANNAPLSSFKHRNGTSSTEIDREDVLTEIYWNRQRYPENPNAVLNILSWTFKSGRFYPGCRRNTGLDVNCMDTNRWMICKRDLQKSNLFARLANDALTKGSDSKTADSEPRSAHAAQAPNQKRARAEGAALFESLKSFFPLILPLLVFVVGYGIGITVF